MLSPGVTAGQSESPIKTPFAIHVQAVYTEYFASNTMILSKAHETQPSSFQLAIIITLMTQTKQTHDEATYKYIFQPGGASASFCGTSCFCF